MSDQFKLYIIYSNKGLNDILKLIFSNTLLHSQIGSLRKDYMRNTITGEYKDNNRRFIILTENVFNDLKNAGFANENGEDFFIDEFVITDENGPPKDSLIHYYYPGGEENKNMIEERLLFLSMIGLFNRSDYSVSNNIVELSYRIPKYIKIIVKIILDTKECRVSWCRKKAFYKR